MVVILRQKTPVAGRRKGPVVARRHGLEKTKSSVGLGLGLEKSNPVRPTLRPICVIHNDPPALPRFPALERRDGDINLSRALF
jgi:hypothetical protein